MLFYLAAAFVLAMRWRLAAISGLCVVWIYFLVVRYFGPYPASAPAQFLGNPMIFEFLAGAALANLRQARPIIAVIGVLGGAILFGLAGTLPWVHDAWNAFSGRLGLQRVAFFGVPAITLVYAALQFEHVLTNRFGRLLTYLGDCSYSLYLLHPLVLVGLEWVLRRVGASGLPVFAIGLVLVTVCAAVAYEGLEKPLLRVGAAVWPRPVLGGAVAVSSIGT
jgi:exopolysaccharide production protein ExoZ